jgi:D-2-hydroxyacid dehydrogenase (NADP+)
LKFGILLSRQIAAEFGETILAGARAAGVEAELLHLPEDPKARFSPAELARVNAGFLTRDIRFSEHLQSYIDTVTTAPNMKWIHFISSGISQWKWVPGMLERGVRVSTSTGANAEPVAQIGLLGLLVCARKVWKWVEGQHKHEWAALRGKEMPLDLEGQKIVIVGVGSIGRRVAEFAKMLKLHVIGVRRSARRPDDPVDEMVHPSKLRELLPSMDYVMLTCPLTDETRKLIDGPALASMKPTACVINMARGEVVDEQALIDALKRKVIAGAYLDVFEQEPLPADSPLWDLPNVVLSPHNASSSQGNEKRATNFFVENIGRLTRGEPLVNEFKLGMAMTSD